MIPEHLQGKSAAQICDEIKEQAFDGCLGEGEDIAKEKELQQKFDMVYRDYVLKLEMLLLLSIKDALCNVDGKNLCDGDYGLMGSEAEGRAIAFLNEVLPYENKT